jgi:RNA polymerase sigma-70 factor, ECF subfamily
LDVIPRAQAGDGEAFAALFHQYKNLVYRTALLITSSTGDAEDILQEVFLRVHATLASYDPAKGAFTTWLYRVTVNLCLSRQRKHTPRTTPLIESAPGAPSPEAQIAEAQELDHALSGLSEKQRAVIFLRYYAGLSYAEIAQVLEVPIGTVQSRLNAALQTLRQNMNSTEGALEPKALRKKGVTG